MIIVIKEPMRRGFKWLAWSFGLLLLAFGGVALWIHFYLPSLLKDCYGQWTSAELVIEYHIAHSSLPANWQDLRETYGDGKGYHTAYTNFDEIKERIVIDFGKLPDLQNLARQPAKTNTLPKIIYPKDGEKAYWSGAEPNELVYKYFWRKEHPSPPN